MISIEYGILSKEVIIDLNENFSIEQIDFKPFSGVR